ncbi:hypothetical protein ACS0TY_030850 [Phlomoides rotata]
MEEERMMKIGVSEKFNLERAVCNHGFFMMPPNKWIPSQKCLLRPLSSNLTLSITQPPTKHYILITILSPSPLSPHQKHSIRCQVARMLRISTLDDMMVHEFHQIHPFAKKIGFARIFCSPTLFEDIVKSILLCCCRWGRSLKMAEALCNLECKLYGKKNNKKRGRNDEYCLGNFPSPKEIVACLNAKTLNNYCNLGFRASPILELSRNIENGDLNLDDFETSRIPTAPTYDLATSHHKLLWNRLLGIKGFGAFTVANVMMCIGFYQYIPIDTETIQHLEQVHGKTLLGRTKREREVESESIISQIYDKYAPFQCLAYWMERVEYYEKNLGRLSDLPHSRYCNVTSTNFHLQTCGKEE